MKKKKMKISAVPIIIAIAVLLFGAILFVEKPELVPIPAADTIYAEGGSGAKFLPKDPDKRLVAFANQNDVSIDEWSDGMKNLMRKVPEAESFVLNYPFMKDDVQYIDLSMYENCTEMPHLMQWDTQWGYTQYSGDLFGLTGCGPTCLSMVSIYLLQDTKYDPRYIADFSEENGYYTTGSGSNWTLMSQGGKKLGMQVKELPLVWDIIKDNLEDGNPVVCVMGPGDFTETGHFIVLSGVQDGMLKVLDPNSITRTEKLWDFEKIQDQIQNLWVFKAPEVILEPAAEE
jgi:hypothetical protein